MALKQEAEQVYFLTKQEEALRVKEEAFHRAKEEALRRAKEEADQAKILALQHQLNESHNALERLRNTHELTVLDLNKKITTLNSKLTPAPVTSTWEQWTSWFRKKIDGTKFADNTRSNEIKK